MTKWIIWQSFCFITQPDSAHKRKNCFRLTKGKIVITDRFSDSTAAYQGYGRGISLRLIDSLDRIATGRMRPDFTILLDLDVEAGLMRNKHINKVDRLELEDVKFHKKVREGFLKLAAKEPKRIKLVKASKGIAEIHREIVRVVEKILK